MLSFFQRSRDPTYKMRVEAFWRWFQSVSNRFLETIDKGQCRDLTDEVSDAVSRLMPRAWVFGPGKNGVGHSFTLSGEGNPHLQFLAAYWLSQAPTLDGWTFHASRQPSPSVANWSIEMDGVEFASRAFWLTPWVDHRREKINITVWHPSFSDIAEKARWTFLFLFLDEALGEVGTQNWIGEIAINGNLLADAIPLSELPDVIQRTATETGWKKTEPGGRRIAYHRDSQTLEFPRSDIIAGTTSHIRLIEEHLESNGNFADPVAGSGADYVYVTMDADGLPPGKQVEARGALEDALTGALEAGGSGRLPGGALGTRYAYIDLLLFEGARSIRLIRDTLRAARVPSGASIEYFAKEKRGHRVLI